MSDRLRITIEDVCFIIAPMSEHRKSEMRTAQSMHGGDEISKVLDSQSMYIKYCLKDIEGVENFAGDKYELEFTNDSQTELTAECVSEVMNIEQTMSIVTAAYSQLNGIRELVDHETGKRIEGVKLEVQTVGKSGTLKVVTI